MDIAIIGGGIAGLSCAAFLGQGVSAVVLEAEPTLGYHATGRSAALYTECYGNEIIRRLTTLSRPFLSEPTHNVLSQRGVLFVAPVGDSVALQDAIDQFSPFVSNLRRLSADEVEEMCALFPASRVAGGVYEPDAADIDVDALLTTYTGMARANGVHIRTGSPVAGIARVGTRWDIACGSETFTADIVVNAAGAWGDRVASLAGIATLGLQPMVRSVFTFDPGADPQPWPMVVEAREQWYIKPEGPLMLGSAASEIPSDPVDARATELDVALGIDKITTASSLKIRSVKNTWAGLRTFAPDRIPVVGRAVDHPSFVWLVGQGGYGIMTSPAVGEFAASVVLETQPPPSFESSGIDFSPLDPARFA